MQKRSRKDEDTNQVAFRVIRAATEGEPCDETDAQKVKNPAAVALGRLGGLKGGKARAKKLSKKQRSESARKAANARWHKNDQDSLAED